MTTWNAPPRTTRPWWETSVLYQIYPRSFYDSNGDGNGDLVGIVDKLDYVSRLGVDGIWLNPTFPSPNKDWGYDVSDYYGVHPDFGSLDTIDTLVRECHERRLTLLLDLVPNHTSIDHPWFVSALSSPSSPYRPWYVFAPGRGEGPPNNWRSATLDPAWSRDEASGEWYLHQFLPSQMDLDWWNRDVRKEFDAIVRFWLDRGVDGFRIDVANGMIKDKDLRDNPPSTPGDPLDPMGRGVLPVYTENCPGVHDVHRHLKDVTRSYTPPRLLYGETYSQNVNLMAEYYGDHEGDELDLAYNLTFINTPFEREPLRKIISATLAALPDHAWPSWTLSNHDVPRLATRWGEGNKDRIRLALLLLLTLPGTPILYYGDELGLVNGEISLEERKDPMVPHQGETVGRDPSRTPMPWSTDSNNGFCPADVTPWLPARAPDDMTVARQEADPTSTLHWVRDLLAVRRATPDLEHGGYEEIDSSDLLGYRRGEHIVLLNISPNEVALPPHLTVQHPLFSTSVLTGPITVLAPFEGIVARFSPTHS